RAARGRDRGRRSQLADDSSAAQAENFSIDVEHIDLAVDFQSEEPAEDVEQLVAEEGVGVEREEAEEKSDRPRRRRRRRGRRGARRADEQEADQDSSAAEAPGGLEDELDEDDLAEEEGEELEGGSADASEGRRTKHRNIPTWDEAVGVVVAANKEARARAAKSTGRSRSRRGRGRPSRGSQDQAK
ncbi:MAG: hypothetical protein GTO03_11760, partial [Planctomycetales bacterium]|nr:hypothetical protein [Planctomycetales bacterium]